MVCHKLKDLKNFLHSGKTYHNSSPLFKKNHATWNHPLVVHKGVRILLMPDASRPWDINLYFKSEEDELLVKHKLF